MKCPVTGQPCNKKKPYQITDVVDNSAVRTLCVCEDCLKLMVGKDEQLLKKCEEEVSNPVESPEPPPEPVAEPTPEIVSGLLNFLNKIIGAIEKPKNIDSKICPKCGSTPSSIQQTGKLGCEYCYHIFNLDPLLMQLHGAVKHVGKVPKKWKAQQEKSQKSQEIQDLESKLQEKLKLVIEKERYEDASEINGFLSNLAAAKKRTEDLGMKIKEAIEKGSFENAERFQKELQLALSHYFEIQEAALRFIEQFV